jgi:hypothetical protein
LAAVPQADAGGAGWSAGCADCAALTLLRSADCAGWLCCAALIYADEAAMKRALAARAAETYVLASAEKIGTASRYAVLPLDAVTAVITDVGGDDPTVAELVRNQVEVIFAEATGR